MVSKTLDQLGARSPSETEYSSAKAVGTPGQSIEEGFVQDGAGPSKATTDGSSKRCPPCCLRDTFTVSLLVVVASLFATAVVLVIRNETPTVKVNGEDVAGDIVDFNVKHPFNPPNDLFATSDMEVERFKVIEEETQKVMQIFNMSDEEIAAKYGGYKNIISQHRHLQSGPIYHEPDCAPITEPCTEELTEADLISGVIECGVCKRVSVSDGRELLFPFGLRIVGKLEFTSTANVIVKTPLVFVHGDLKIHLPNTGNQVIFRMHGSVAQTYFGNGPCVSGCDLGHKPIAVLGGALKSGCVVLYRTGSRMHAYPSFPTTNNTNRPNGYCWTP